MLLRDKCEEWDFKAQTKGRRERKRKGKEEEEKERGKERGKGNWKWSFGFFLFLFLSFPLHFPSTFRLRFKIMMLLHKIGRSRVSEFLWMKKWSIRTKKWIFSTFHFRRTSWELHFSARSNCSRTFKGSVERSRHERHFCSLLPYFLLSWLQIFQLCLSFSTSSFDLVLF